MSDQKDKKTVQDGRDLFDRFSKGGTIKPDQARDPRILAGYALYDHYHGTHYAGKATAKEDK